MDNLIQKAEVLLEALPYVQKFRHSIFVIKYGGSFMDSPDPAVRNGVARDIVFFEAVGINPLVVHGGGKAITRAMDGAGIKANFVGGMRVTDEPTMRIVADTLDREIQPEIVRAIESFGGKAKGFSGREIFRCRKLGSVSRLQAESGNHLKNGGTGVPPVDSEIRAGGTPTPPSSKKSEPLKGGTPNAAGDLGYVGEVFDVNTEPLRDCIHRSVTPIISPIATGEDGHLYNVNADLAAAKAAIALKARRLVFMSDVPGLLRDPKDARTLISHLQISEVDALKKSGVIDKGMIPKVDSAVEALQGGVHRVHFVDGRVPHSILLEIFTDKGIGTEIVK
jgi:acetylglutamate kinase